MVRFFASGGKRLSRLSVNFSNCNNRRGTGLVAPAHDEKPQCSKEAVQSWDMLTEPPLLFRPKLPMHYLICTATAAPSARLQNAKTFDKKLHNSPSSINVSRGIEATVAQHGIAVSPDFIPQTMLHLRQYGLEIRKVTSYYTRLSKARLSSLVVLTAMGGYAMCPEPFVLMDFILCCLGTAGLAMSANAFNQFLEVPYDSQMKRTQSRVLVKQQVSPLHAVLFGTCAGGMGLTVLALGVNPLTAGLGITNLILYTLVYTPMKRYSIINTWLGSIVGAIPPLMGWAACANALSPASLVLAGVLYAWQFPHFNALSWNLRPDYSQAGYRMMSVTDPQLCCRVTLRYSVILFALCSLGAPITELTTWTFALTSAPLNAYMTLLAWRFYKNPESGSSRKLFRFSLIYLPALMLLMVGSKKRRIRQNDRELIGSDEKLLVN